MSEETNPNNKIVFDDVIFRACRVQVSPGIIVGHNKTLENGFVIELGRTLVDPVFYFVKAFVCIW